MRCLSLRIPAVAVAVAALALASAAAAAGAAPAPPAQPVAEVDDLRLARALELELATQRVAAEAPLEIACLDGVVTVAGQVDDLLERDRVLATIRATRGVRGLVDRTTVSAPSRPDEELRAAVVAALVSEAAVEDGEVSVSVASGKVTLTGSVDSWTERRFAVRAARSVPGVLDVRDALSIAYAEPRTDDDIRRDVERRLAWDVRSRAGLVEVDVKQGNVRLHGVVGSAAEREHAYELAWVAGVRGVDADGLKIRWWAVDRMRRFDPRSQSDEEIAAAVRDALTLDPRVSRLGISVDVSEGVVTLTGAVSSARSRQIAREDAGNVVGVRRVYDLLVVVADGPPGDAEIQRRVAAALAADPYLSRHRLDVAVRDGEVRLSGSVNSAFDRRRAEALAGGMLGVKDVSLALEIVRSGEPVGDPELAERVRDALFWDARIAEERIRVEVADGAVTLRGWTDDPRERTLAEEKAARSGARSVRNEIEVKPERRP